MRGWFREYLSIHRVHVSAVTVVERIRGYALLTDKAAAHFTIPIAPCNHEIGGALEREFCRRSPEAILRSVHWIKGQRRAGQKKRTTHIYQPEKIGGRHMYMFGLDMDGRNILWQTGEQPGSVKEISQIVILDADDNAVEHIAIPTEITTGRELVEILFKKRNATLIDKALVIDASGDEERVQGVILRDQPKHLYAETQRRQDAPAVF